MTVALALAGLAWMGIADAGDARRMDYPDFVRQWPQLKGVMLGASGEKEFRDLRDMGATLVRYQMVADWKTFRDAAKDKGTDETAEYESWLKERLDHLEEMLPWGRKYGIRICVDQHVHLGGLTHEKHSSDMIFAERKYEDLLVATWEKIARRFKGNWDVLYGYDLFNEPITRENALTKRSWHDVFCRVIEAVRAIDPESVIVVEPNCHASPRGFDVRNPYGLKGVDLLPYDNLIYSVHVYIPMGYSHQGLFQKKEDYKPVPYPAANAIADPNRKRYPGDMGEDTGKAELWDKQYVREAIQSVRDFQLRHGVRIFVGEFSAAAYAPGAEKYIGDLCDLFREYGWDWTYHAFRESACWSIEHEGMSYFELKPATKKTPRQEVLEKHMKEGRIQQGFVHDMPRNTNEHPTNPDYDTLVSGFENPFDKVRTGCYWHWLTGNADAEAVRKDLRALKRIGVDLVCFADVDQGGNKPGPAIIFTPAWKAALAAAYDEADKLGIELGLFNCPGWSQSGGPWVTVDRSMRRFAVSSTTVRAGEKKILPLPSCGNPAEYRDFAVVAYPQPPGTDAELTGQATEDGRGTVVLESDAPFTARSLVVELKRALFAATVVLEADCAGKWTRVAAQPFERLLAMQSVGFDPYADVTLAFRAVTARRFRVRIENAREAGGVKRIVLRTAPGIAEVEKKTFAKMFEGHLPAWNEYMWKPQPDEGPGVALPVGGVRVLTDRMDRGGWLDWTPERGVWNVYRIGIAPTRATTQASIACATGYETDKMSEMHIRKHFDDYLGKLLDEIPGGKRAVKHVVMDSYEVGGQNYTDDFVARFRTSFGYDPMPYLPVFAGVAVGSREISDRFLWDLRRFVADEIAYSYVGGLRRKSYERGLTTWLENYGHRGFPGEFLQYGGQSDAVGGEYWSEGARGDIENRAAASCGHIYGKREIWSESNTAVGRPFARGPADLKERTDRFFAEGVNASMLHVSIHQPNDRAPGFISWYGNEFHRHNSWFDHMDLFVGYLKRCNFLLRQGLNVADIAYFIGEDAPVMSGHADPLPPSGREYDFINAEVLSESAAVDARGRIVLPHGTAYEILVLPDSSTMRPAMVRTLARLVEAGAFVVGRKPERSPSLSGWPQADAEVRALADRLWGEVDGSSVRFASRGKGTIAWNLPLSDALSLRRSEADCLVDSGTKVSWCHRTMPNAEIYFLCNRTKEELVGTEVSFRTAGRIPELWDAASVSRREADSWRRVGGRTVVKVDLAPHESVFVVFARKADGRLASNPLPQVTHQEVAGPWTLSFESDALHRGPSEPLAVRMLFDLSTSENPAIKYYSGKILYRTRFVADVHPGARHYLKLGEVAVTAKVRLNGKDVGGVCFPPYRLEVTGAVNQGENELEIEVCDLWINRLVGDASLGPGKSPTWVSLPTGIKTTSELVKSGLLGPVLLQTVTDGAKRQDL